jgi:ADP-heptose:LPS heptosyltransferase
MAFTGQYELVRAKFVELQKEEREFYNDKEILNQVIWGSLQLINQFKAVYNYNAINSETEFLKEVLDQFIIYSHNKKSYPRELFQAIIYVSEELISQSKMEDAAKYLNDSVVFGINKFPNLRVDAINKLSEIYNKKGNIKKSSKELFKFAERPYLLTDRNQVPEVFFRLSKNSLKSGNTKEYKQFLFIGLKYFHTNVDERKRIFNQLLLTYRNSFLLLLNSKVSLSTKLIFLIHWFHFRLPNFGKIKLGFVNSFSRKILLSIIYLYNYFIRSANPLFLKNDVRNDYPVLLEKSEQQANDYKLSKKSKTILITRAMGGIGDLLMITPGIHAVKKKYPNSEIHLAIPSRYFPLFDENNDVKLIDVESDFFSHYKYSRWYNITDCPAARGESLKAPKVKKGRIELFAKALGVRGLRLKLMNEKPRYFITEDEKVFAKSFWKELGLTDRKVIGVQLKADESYRNYPLMEQLVERLSQTYKVLLFDAEKIDGFDFNNVYKIDSFSIRKAFALAHKCDVIIAPDSSFVHFAAAFDKPTVAIFGPVDGKVRTKKYPNCTYVDSRKELGCLPCWRNENIPCKLTGMRNSACLESISITRIINELEIKLSEINNVTFK